MKAIAIFTVIAGIFGCRAPGEKPFMLDGPGMVYVDSEHRTEYANTLPFDEIDDYPYRAVAYLGEGENGKNTAKEYIEKLFSKLSEEQRKSVKHYDYGGEKWYLVIPRYGEENELIQNGDKKNLQKVSYGRLNREERLSQSKLRLNLQKLSLMRIPQRQDVTDILREKPSKH